MKDHNFRSETAHLLIDLQKGQPSSWLITGVAGFIGSNLLETLLLAGQTVRGLDNFATGHQINLDEVRQNIGDESWSRFSFIEGDIRDADTCSKAVEGIDYVLHQAALGSVPRSLADPLTANQVNINGFLNMLDASRLPHVKRLLCMLRPAQPMVTNRICLKEKIVVAIRFLSGKIREINIKGTSNGYHYN